MGEGNTDPQGGIGKALDDTGVKQFVGLAKAALDKLP